MYMIERAAVFLITAAFSFLITPLFINFAHRFKLLDYPRDRKAHSHPMPYIGGCVVFFTFWIVFLIGFLQMHAAGEVPVKFISKFSGVFAGSLLMFVLGFLDDRYNLNPAVKFFFQSLGAVILILFGLKVNLFASFGIWGFAATFVWIVLIVNAFNFIDSIDGHCAGIAFISCLIFSALSLIVFQPILGFCVAVLGGALLGFLPFNMKPAKAFLGDNGSLFLGYMMAALTLLYSYRITNQYSVVTPFIPVFMFGVPIYDTVSVIIVRLYRGIPPWKGDRNHFAHRLVRIGMSEKIAAAVSYFIAFTLGLIAILSTQVTTFLGKLILALLFASVIGIIALLEYYAAMRIRFIEHFTATHRRRKDDFPGSSTENE